MANTTVFIGGNTATENNGTVNILYRTVISNIKEIGHKKYACIPRELLAIDPEYQRIETRRFSKIKKLAENWNFDKMDALSVVPHPEEGKFYIVDGYGRYTASALLAEPLTELECDIKMEAPADPEERRKYEAKLFSTQDEGTDVLKAVDKHKANVLLGDEVATIINDICKKYGVVLTAGRGSRTGKILGCYVKMLPTVRSVGRKGTEFIFDVIEETSWSNGSNAYCTGIIWGLSAAYKIGGDVPGFKEKLVEELRRFDMKVFKTKSAAAYPERDRYVAMKLYMEDKAVEIINNLRK